MMTKKKTFGQAALELQEKALIDPNPIPINEVSRDILLGNADSTSEGESKSYLDRVWETACDAMSKYHTTSCFVEVRYKSTGQFAANSTDKVFIGRQTCPTPTYNQDAFRVYNDGTMDYLWTVPSKLDTRIVLTERFVLALDPEYSELVKMVLDFSDGTLLKMAKSFDTDYKENIA
jgi:hypothetical protein